LNSYDDSNGNTANANTGKIKVKLQSNSHDNLEVEVPAGSNVQMLKNQIKQKLNVESVNLIYLSHLSPCGSVSSASTDEDPVRSNSYYKLTILLGKSGKIYVKSETGTHTISPVDGSCTVDQFKQQIADIVGMKADKQILSYKSKLYGSHQLLHLGNMNDSRRLEIADGAKIYLHKKLSKKAEKNKLKITFGDNSVIQLQNISNKFTVMDLKSEICKRKVMIHQYTVTTNELVIFFTASCS